MRREFRYTPQHAAKAYILQQTAGLDCEADIKSHFDWNCIDPWPEWPDIDSPAIGHCFCHNRDVAERYWKCYYGKVIPCTRETIDLEWIYSKLSGVVVAKADDSKWRSGIGGRIYDYFARTTGSQTRLGPRQRTSTWQGSTARSARISICGTIQTRRTVYHSGGHDSDIGRLHGNSSNCSQIIHHLNAAIGCYPVLSCVFHATKRQWCRQGALPVASLRIPHLTLTLTLTRSGHVDICSFLTRTSSESGERIVSLCEHDD
jgi:hypothetical protein